jgi:carbon-monoxide dehydrogenase small subunit
MKVKIFLNGEKIEMEINPLKRLLDVLREDLNIKSVKEGCGEGECGSCMVIINEKVYNSCLIPVGSVNNKKILTIEGIENKKILKEIKRRLKDEFQCGFCENGMLISLYALFKNKRKPNKEEIKEAISGNLCRCTGYQNIVNKLKIWKNS